MIIDINDRLQDKAGSTYEVLSIAKTDNYFYHSQYGGIKIEVQGLSGSNKDKVILVDHKLLKTMMDEGKIWLTTQ